MTRAHPPLSTARMNAAATQIKFALLIVLKVVKCSKLDRRRWWWQHQPSESALLLSQKRQQEEEEEEEEEKSYQTAAKRGADDKTIDQSRCRVSSLLHFPRRS